MARWNHTHLMQIGCPSSMDSRLLKLYVAVPAGDVTGVTIRYAEASNDQQQESTPFWPKVFP
jgi:hypothetical protein